ncbi:hypothetical protein [Paenibacillus oryzisoli]|uniref:Uncharacterized protein n=1 Tax=Paenibacillus oryzisoli TaxID=1850517 RepID=A0A198A7L3_9BACL|nr:hypothetical protein [Paenibacillus oryzisoli]OAS17464.1 hypothetical protein A8708_22120 [Paenibacillus oryzisoli]
MEWNEGSEGKLSKAITKEEMQNTKAFLLNHKQDSILTQNYEKNEDKRVVTSEQKEEYEAAKKRIEVIETVLSLITDDDTRQIIEYRYVKGLSRKYVNARINYVERTIDRRAELGIKLIIQNLKRLGFAGYIYPGNPLMEYLHAAKKILDDYPKSKLIVKDYEEHKETSTELQRKVYEQSKLNVEIAERAVSVIADSETRKLVEFRFIKGNTRKLTVLRFTGSISESTIDRRLEEGIRQIADTLASWV